MARPLNADTDELHNVRMIMDRLAKLDPRRRMRVLDFLCDWAREGAGLPRRDEHPSQAVIPECAA